MTRYQWITGKPTADDSCKCPAEATDGPYCAEHMAMAYTVKPREDKPWPAPRAE